MIVPASTAAQYGGLQGAPQTRRETDKRSDPDARVVVFHGVFDGWGWELVANDGEVLAESQFQFESREECVRDARERAGFPQGRSLSLLPAAS